MNVQDYVMVAREGSSLQLAKIVDVETLQVLYDKNSHDPDKLDTEVIRPDQIVLNLGQKPRFGSVYGVTIEPFISQLFTEKYGNIRFYRHVEPEDKKTLRRAFKECYAELEAKNCHNTMPLDWEIRNQKGKYEGSCKYRPKGVDLITLKPEIFDFESLKHLIFHEVGHSVWFRQVRKSYKTRWVKLYHWYTQQVSDSELLNDIRHHVETTGSFKGTSIFGDRAKEITSACLNHFKKVHFLSPENVEDCIQDKEFMDKIFPTSLELGFVESPLGEYAGTSVEEFWAESFRLVFLNKQLPDLVQDLFDETIVNLAIDHEKE